MLHGRGGFLRPALLAGEHLSRDMPIVAYLGQCRLDGLEIDVTSEQIHETFDRAD